MTVAFAPFLLALKTFLIMLILGELLLEERETLCGNMINL